MWGRVEPGAGHHPAYIQPGSTLTRTTKGGLYAHGQPAVLVPSAGEHAARGWTGRVRKACGSVAYAPQASRILTAQEFSARQSGVENPSWAEPAKVWGSPLTREEPMRTDPRLLAGTLQGPDAFPKADGGARLQGMGSHAQMVEMNELARRSIPASHVPSNLTTPDLSPGVPPGGAQAPRPRTKQGPESSGSTIAVKEKPAASPRPGQPGKGSAQVGTGSSKTDLAATSEAQKGAEAHHSGLREGRDAKDQDLRDKVAGAKRDRSRDREGSQSKRSRSQTPDPVKWPARAKPGAFLAALGARFGAEVQRERQALIKQLGARAAAEPEKAKGIKKDVALLEAQEWCGLATETTLQATTRAAAEAQVYRAQRPAAGRTLPDAEYPADPEGKHRKTLRERQAYAESGYVQAVAIPGTADGSDPKAWVILGRALGTGDTKGVPRHILSSTHMINGRLRMIAEDTARMMIAWRHGVLADLLLSQATIRKGDEFIISGSGRVAMADSVEPHRIAKHGMVARTNGKELRRAGDTTSVPQPQAYEERHRAPAVGACLVATPIRTGGTHLAEIVADAVTSRHNADMVNMAAATGEGIPEAAFTLPKILAGGLPDKAVAAEGHEQGAQADSGLDGDAEAFYDEAPPGDIAAIAARRRAKIPGRMEVARSKRQKRYAALQKSQKKGSPAQAIARKLESRYTSDSPQRCLQRAAQHAVHGMGLPIALSKEEADKCRIATGEAAEAISRKWIDGLLHIQGKLQRLQRQAPNRWERPTVWKAGAGNKHRNGKWAIHQTKWEKDEYYHQDEYAWTHLRIRAALQLLAYAAIGANDTIVVQAPALTGGEPTKDGASQRAAAVIGAAAALSDIQPLIHQQTATKEEWNVVDYAHPDKLHTGETAELDELIQAMGLEKLAEQVAPMITKGGYADDISGTTGGIDALVGNHATRYYTLPNSQPALAVYDALGRRLSTEEERSGYFAKGEGTEPSAAPQGDDRVARLGLGGVVFRIEPHPLRTAGAKASDFTGPQLASFKRRRRVRLVGLPIIGHFKGRSGPMGSAAELLHTTDKGAPYPAPTGCPACGGLFHHAVTSAYGEYAFGAQEMCPLVAEFEHADPVAAIRSVQRWRAKGAAASGVNACAKHLWTSPEDRATITTAKTDRPYEVAVSAAGAPKNGARAQVVRPWGLHQYLQTGRQILDGMQALGPLDLDSLGEGKQGTRPTTLKARKSADWDCGFAEALPQQAAQSPYDTPRDKEFDRRMLPEDAGGKAAKAPRSQKGPLTMLSPKDGKERWRKQFDIESNQAWNCDKTWGGGSQATGWDMKGTMAGMMRRSAYDAMDRGADTIAAASNQRGPHEDVDLMLVATPAEDDQCVAKGGWVCIGLESSM